MSQIAGTNEAQTSIRSTSDEDAAIKQMFEETMLQMTFNQFQQSNRIVQEALSDLQS